MIKANDSSGKLSKDSDSQENPSKSYSPEYESKTSINNRPKSSNREDSSYLCVHKANGTETVSRRHNLKIDTMIQPLILRFKTTAPMLLPDFINNTLLGEVVMYDDYALLHYALTVPMSLERALDLMELVPDMVLLYHYVPSAVTDFGQELCFYAYPDAGSLFKLNLVAGELGQVEDVTVTVYESLEQMSFDLLDDLQRHDQRGTYRERRSEMELMADFS